MWTWGRSEGTSTFSQEFIPTLQVLKHFDVPSGSEEFRIYLPFRNGVGMRDTSPDCGRVRDAS